MFSHIMVGSNDIARSKKFYDALFAAIGAQPGTEDARGRGLLAQWRPFHGVKPIDGKPAAANGGTIGFAIAIRNRPRRGTKPASRMAARRSRTRPACVLRGRISLIFVIPMETSWSRLPVRLPDYL